MCHCEGNTVTETPPLSRPWVKKGLAGCFLHRLLQDGDGLSGPALPGHVQLRADRHALRCQDVVVGGGGLKQAPINLTGLASLVGTEGKSQQPGWEQGAHLVFRFVARDWKTVRPFTES